MDRKALAAQLLSEIMTALETDHVLTSVEAVINKYADSGESISMPVPEWMLIIETVAEDIEELPYFGHVHRAHCENNDLSNTKSYKLARDIVAALIDLYAMSKEDKQAFIEKRTESFMLIYLPGITSIIACEVETS